MLPMVHEAKLAPHANAGGEANHAAPAASGGNQPETPEGSTQAASGGGDGEPVAYAVVEHGGGSIVFATPDQEEAEMYAGTVVPLYRSPPQPRADVELVVVLPEPVGETKSHGPLLRKRDVVDAIASSGLKVAHA